MYCKHNNINSLLLVVALFCSGTQLHYKLYLTLQCFTFSLTRLQCVSQHECNYSGMNLSLKLGLTLYFSLKEGFCLIPVPQVNGIKFIYMLNFMPHK